jgi:hypothetical protein
MGRGGEGEMSYRVLVGKIPLVRPRIGELGLD